jgi:MFS family permease
MRSNTLVHHFQFLDHLFYSDDNQAGYYLMMNNVHMMLIGAFEVPLIYRLTGSIEMILLYYLIFYLIVGISLILSAKIFYQNTIGGLFRISIIFNILLTSGLVIFYSSLANLWVLMGYAFLRGIRDGIYWYGNHYVMLDVVKDDKRDNFVLTLQSISVILPIVFPLMGGLIITFANFESNTQLNQFLPNGYLAIFILDLLFSLMSYIYSPDLVKKIESSVSYRQVLKLFVDKRVKHLRNYLAFDTSQIVLLSTALSLMNFLILKNEANLGFFSSILAFVASFYFIFLKKINQKVQLNKLKLYFFGNIGEVVSRLFYFSFTNIYGLIIKATFNSLVLPLKQIFGDLLLMKKYTDISQKTNVNKITLHVFQETLFMISRTVVIALFLIAVHFLKVSPTDFCRMILLITGFIVFFDYPLLKKASEE